MIDTTDATFEQDVLQASVPVVVEFTAPWCKPCRAIEPWLESLEERYEGRFVRTLRLPASVSEGKIDAVYSDGVLTVKLPKVEPAAKARIAIK